MRAVTTLGVVSASVATCVALLRLSPQERFHLSSIPSTGMRINPDPLWVKAKWDEKANSPYAAIRKEIGATLDDRTFRDTKGVWSQKSRAAYHAWYEDFQNPVKLFRVTAYLAAAAWVDPAFGHSNDYKDMTGAVTTGWSLIRAVPQSYDFVRRGYILTAGNHYYHRYGNLAFRLLKRDPLDGGVIIAMVYEYANSKPRAEFEQRMFQGFKDLGKLKNRSGNIDSYHWAVALRLYGQKHRKKSAYDEAIQKALAARAALIPGSDPAFIDKFLAECKKEREDPMFGIPFKNFKYVDDEDPPPKKHGR